MKLGAVTKLDNRNKTTSKKKKKKKKKLTMTPCPQIVTPLSFFGFMANLDQSRRIICETFIFINSDLLS